MNKLYTLKNQELKAISLMIVFLFSFVFVSNAQSEKASDEKIQIVIGGNKDVKGIEPVIPKERQNIQTEVKKEDIGNTAEAPDAAARRKEALAVAPVGIAPVKKQESNPESK